MTTDLSDWAGPTIVTAIVLWQIFAFWPRPKGDGPRIKRDFESNGARVVSIRSTGIDLDIFRRSHGYRKYDIVVECPFKGRVRYKVGVSASFLSDELKTY